MLRRAAILRARAHNKTTDNKTIVRLASSVAASQDEWSTAKPFSEIPGPKPLPIPKYGNVWRVLPFGTYHGKAGNKLISHLADKYGPLVRFKGFGISDSIIVTDPKDAEKVFRNEGPWPIRNGLDSMHYYRTQMKHEVYGGNPGLATSQGELWQQNRTNVNQPVARPKNVLIYLRPIESIADDFIKRMKAIREENSEMPQNFDNELCKWALESIGMVSLDTRLGCLDGELQPGSDSQLMIDSVDQAFKTMFNLDFQPSMWKIYSTKDWKTFVKAMDNITGIALKHVLNKKREIALRSPTDEEGLSILETLLRSKGGEQAAIILTIDLLFGGVDTTSNSVAHFLYCISKNPKAQEKLFQELRTIMPNENDSLPSNFDNVIPYLKACMKETQRLTPIVPANQRALVKDLVLQGYQVPSGQSIWGQKNNQTIIMTEVIISHHTMCMNEKNFERPDEFIPERWLEDKSMSISAKNAHPFAFMPFGFGPRMCIGRRLAELEMRVVLAKLLRKFKVSYPHEEMKWKVELITTPDSPLNFKVEDRPN